MPPIGSDRTSVVDAQLLTGPLPVVKVGPLTVGAEPEWVADNSEALHAVVRQHGVAVVRGLGLATPADLARVSRHLGSMPMAEPEPFALRHHYHDHVYSSSEWPADQAMCMHHEASFASRPPATMLIACLTAADQGGATGVADASRMLAELPDDLVTRFERDGWLLTRNYSDAVGLPWPAVFGTDDRDAIAGYCARNGIEHRWLPDGGLRTRQRLPAVVRHPVTGERCWFNQIAFLSRWTLDESIRDYLEFEFGEDGLPFDSALGDGEPITRDIVAEINSAYERITLRQLWRAGDLLIVDNIRTAHSREPYQGRREVAVVLADPIPSWGS